MYNFMIYVGLSFISFFVIVFLNSTFNRREKFNPMYIDTDDLIPPINVILAAILFPVTYLIGGMFVSANIIISIFKRINSGTFLKRLTANIASYNSKDVPCCACNKWCNKEKLEDEGWTTKQTDNVISYFCRKHSNNEIKYTKYNFESDVYQCEICSVYCKKFACFRHPNMNSENFERIIICDECIEYFYYNVKKLRSDCLE